MDWVRAQQHAASPRMYQTVRLREQDFLHLLWKLQEVLLCLEVGCVTLRALAYDLDIELLPVPSEHPIADAPGRIGVSCTVRLRNEGRRPASQVHLLLYRLLRILSAAEWNATEKPLLLRQSVRRMSVEGADTLYVNAVTLSLAQELEPGRETTLRLHYGGTLVGYREAFAYVHDSVQRDVAVLRPEVLWYPLIARASWEGFLSALSVPHFHMTVHLPERWDCFVASSEASDRTHRQVQFTSATPSLGMYLIAGRYGHLHRGEIHVHHLPGREEWARAACSAASFARSTLRSWLGPPAFGEDRVTIVQIPAGWGSQNLPGMITQTGESDPERTFREVVHEVAHFWTPLGDPNRFCDEAMAHFLEDLLEREKNGEQRGEAAFARHLDALRDSPGALRAPLATAAGRLEIDVISRHKGPLALAVLDASIGRARFFQLLRDWVANPVAAGASAGTFAEFVRRALVGEQAWNVQKFLDDWFYSESDTIQPNLPIAAALDRAVERYKRSR